MSPFAFRAVNPRHWILPVLYLKYAQYLDDASIFYVSLRIRSYHAVSNRLILSINVTTIINMEIEYDSTKSNKNIKERGLSFELVKGFDIDTAMIETDNRFDYDEQRFNAIGSIGDTLYRLTFTMRVDVLRVISLRYADRREVKDYVLKN